MDLFQSWKKNFLSKKDKSNKGEIDMPIKPLIDTINKLENYFTTSSCSGRIIILIEPESGLKKDYKFLFESHEVVDAPDIKKALGKIPKRPLWLRFESMILHVACRTIIDANKLLKTAQKLFKHSGIISIEDKYTLEIRGSEFIEAPVAYNGRVVVSDDFIDFIVGECNKKLKLNHTKINKLKVNFCDLTKVY